MPLLSARDQQRSGDDNNTGSNSSMWDMLKHGIHKIAEEINLIRGGDQLKLVLLLSDCQMLGFIVGTVPWLRSLPCESSKTSLKLLGESPIPGVTLIIGGNLVKGIRRPDPLYQKVPMLQFALPPALSIGTMAQLYHVAQEECCVIFVQTYLVAALAFTIWSTVFMTNHTP